MDLSHYFSKNSLKPSIRIDNHTFHLCSIRSFYDFLGLYNLGQILIFIHFADLTDHADVISKCVFQYKVCLDFNKDQIVHNDMLGSFH